MEIERKFTIKKLPEHLEKYERKQIEQAYLCRNPVVRVRQSNEDYILTYKSKILLPPSGHVTARSCEEVELPLTKEAYAHLKEKADGNIITKDRYLIPLEHGRNIELDIFKGYLEGLIFAEVEFGSEEEAAAFQMPDWFSEDVTFDKRYSNGHLANIKSEDIWWNGGLDEQ